MTAERRRHSRILRQGAVSVRMADSAAEIGVRLTNLSDCGFGVIVTKSVPTGTRVFVKARISDGDSAIFETAMVRWCGQTSEGTGYSAGLERVESPA